jgi:O-antigen/teichoic acid export membrane protein
MAAGLGFVLNLVLARLLEVDEYGRIFLIFSLVTVLYTIFDFGFNSAQVIFYNRTKEEYGEDVAFGYIANTYKYWFLISNLISLFAMFFLVRKYSMSGLESICLYSSFSLFTLFRYYISSLQALGYWSAYNKLNILNSIVKSTLVLSFIFTLPAFISSFNMYESALVGFFLYPIFLLLFVCFLYPKIKKGNSPKELTNAFHHSYFRTLLPIGIVAFLSIVIMRVDLLIIEHFLGFESLGIYAASSSLALAFPLITASIMNVFLKKMSESGVEYLAVIFDKQKRLIFILPIIALSVYLLSPYIFNLLYGERYSGGGDVFALLVVSYLGGIYFTPFESYFYAHKPYLILYIRFFQLLAMVLVQVLLIRYLGLIGIAIGIFVSRLISWLAITVLTSKELKYSAARYD